MAAAAPNMTINWSRPKQRSIGERNILAWSRWQWPKTTQAQPTLWSTTELAQVTHQRKLDRLKRSSWFEVIRLFEKQLLISCSSAAATVGRHGQTHQPDSAAI
jgi:hypothetical protein